MRGTLGALVAVAALAVPPGAEAGIPTSLKSSCVGKDAADDDGGNGLQLPYVLCDDGVPDAGGTIANPGAVKAVAVPAAYTGPGEPVKDPAAAAQVPGQSGGDVALDVNLSLPDPAANPMPRGGYPLMVMFSGCCSGNKLDWGKPTIDTTSGAGGPWHYNNAWFAARGYVVVTWTQRGFVDREGRGSTGQTQVSSTRFEINDYQYLAGLVADATFEVGGQQVRVDPARVVVTGGSVGGASTWLALSEPSWTSPEGRHMRLVAVAPKYGFTDLVYSLIPSGAHGRDGLPPTDASASVSPLGFPKRSIVAGLFAQGTTNVPPGNHATFPPSFAEAVACLQSFDPFEANPLCQSTLSDLLPAFITDRSAYYQNEFFARIASDRSARVPVFSAGAFTDPIFPSVEHRRVVDRLTSLVPDYPVQEYYGDYQHFTQDKATEWADLCGSDRHVCRYRDFPGGDLNAEPTGLVRLGVNTRLNRFVDYYARPPGNPSQRKPDFDVTAALQVCPESATSDFPANEPGERVTESRFSGLAPGTLRLSASDVQNTTNEAAPNPHAVTSDPILNEQRNGRRCPVETDPAGPGVATYDFPPLPNDVTMIGRTRVTVPHTGSGQGLQLNARLYEVLPDRRQVLVDRGVRRVAGPSQTTVFDLHGQGWRFRAGNRIRIELAQDDDPYIKASNQASSLTLAGVTLEIPVREAGPDAAIDAPRLASDAGTSARFPLHVGGRSGELTGVARTELLIRDTRARRWRALPVGARSFRGRSGRTYRLRARLFDGRGVPGDVASAITVVPLDDRRIAGPRPRRLWRRVRSRQAYGRGLSRSTRRGATLGFRFRGDRLYLVGRRSRRGGKALVVLNGRRRVVSFRSRQTRNRAVIAQLRARRRGVNRLRLVVLRGRVEIDAIGVRRL
jgi:hypothetical protein